MTRDCLDGGPQCAGIAEPGSSRCRPCEARYQRLRNRSPKRQAYRDPVYQAQAKTGICWLCHLPGADTRDHVMPIATQMERWGEVRDHRTQPAHRSCNSARGDRMVNRTDRMTL